MLKVMIGQGARTTKRDLNAPSADAQHGINSVSAMATTSTNLVLGNSSKTHTFSESSSLSKFQLNTSTLADFKFFVYVDTITMTTHASASVRVSIGLIAKLSLHVPQHVVHPCLSTVGMLDIYASFGD